MECDHESVTAIEANIVGVGYHALCLKCGNKIFVSTDTKHMDERKINKLVASGYSKEVAEKMVASQRAMKDDSNRVKSEAEAQKAEEERRRK
jgi:hypothetical protein